MKEGSVKSAGSISISYFSPETPLVFFDMLKYVVGVISLVLRFHDIPKKAYAGFSSPSFPSFFNTSASVLMSAYVAFSGNQCCY